MNSISINALVSEEESDFFYKLEFSTENNTILLTGKFRLRVYDEIYDWLLKVYQSLTSEVTTLTFDFTQVTLINSSGISIICDFLDELEENESPFKYSFFRK